MWCFYLCVIVAKNHYEHIEKPYFTYKNTTIFSKIETHYNHKKTIYSSLTYTIHARKKRSRAKTASYDWCTGNHGRVSSSKWLEGKWKCQPRILALMTYTTIFRENHSKLLAQKQVYSWDLSCTQKWRLPYSWSWIFWMILCMMEFETTPRRVIQWCTK